MHNVSSEVRDIAPLNGRKLIVWLNGKRILIADTPYVRLFSNVKSHYEKELNWTNDDMKMAYTKTSEYKSLSLFDQVSIYAAGLYYDNGSFAAEKWCKDVSQVNEIKHFTSEVFNATVNAALLLASTRLFTPEELNLIKQCCDRVKDFERIERRMEPFIKEFGIDKFGLFKSISVV